MSMLLLHNFMFYKVCKKGPKIKCSYLYFFVSYFLQVICLYFLLCIALFCVLGLKEIWLKCTAKCINVDICSI